MADRVEGYTTNATKVRDGADVLEMVYDPSAVTAIDRLNATMGEVLAALKGIRARLDAGINTKTVTTLAAVNV